ncbi:unnamed protein product, partial [Ectocarpus sp. 12 AP-2014]
APVLWIGRVFFLEGFRALGIQRRRGGHGRVVRDRLGPPEFLHEPPAEGLPTSPQPPRVGQEGGTHQPPRPGRSRFRPPASGPTVLPRRLRLLVLPAGPGRSRRR